MYCFYYLCHEEAAIIKVGVEVLQCRVAMSGIDCVWEYSRYIYDFSLVFSASRTHTHTHTHTLLRRCVFTTVVSIMFMLALLKNQNKNLKETGSWTEIEKPVTDVWNLQTFQFLIIIQKVETVRRQSLKDFSFLWLYLFCLRGRFVWRLLSFLERCSSLCLQQSGKTHVWFIRCKL